MGLALLCSCLAACSASTAGSARPPQAEPAAAATLRDPPEVAAKAGLLAEANGQLGVAESRYHSALSARSDGWAGWFHLARVQLLLGKHDEARQSAHRARDYFTRQAGERTRRVRRAPIGAPLGAVWLGNDWLAVVDQLSPRVLVYSRKQREVVMEVEALGSQNQHLTPQVGASRVLSYVDERGLHMTDLATLRPDLVPTARPIVWYALSVNGAWLGSYEAWGATVQSLGKHKSPVVLSLLGAAEARFAEPRCSPAVDPPSPVWAVSLHDAGGHPMPHVPFRATAAGQTLLGTTDAEGRVELPEGGDFIVEYGHSPYLPDDATAPAFDYLARVSTQSDPGVCISTRHASHTEFPPSSGAVLLWGEGGTRLYSLPDGQLTRDWNVRVRRAFGFSADSGQFLFEREDPEPDTLYRLDLEQGTLATLHAPGVISAGWVGNRIAMLSDATISVWDRDMVQPIWSRSAASVGIGTQLRGDPDANALAVTDEQGFVLYATATGAIESSLRDIERSRTRAAFGDDGGLNLCGLHWCRTVDVENGAVTAARRQSPPSGAERERGYRQTARESSALDVLQQLDVAREAGSWAVATRDGSSVVSGVWPTNELTVFDLASGRRETKSIHGGDYLTGFSAVRDASGRLLIAAEGGNRTRVIDWTNGRVIFHRWHPEHGRDRAALSTDGRYLAMSFAGDTALRDPSALAPGPRWEVVELDTRRSVAAFALLDEAESEALLWISATAGWRFMGADAERLERQYACAFGAVLGPFEWCGD